MFSCVAVYIMGYRLSSLAPLSLGGTRHVRAIYNSCCCLIIIIIIVIISISSSEQRGARSSLIIITHRALRVRQQQLAGLMSCVY